MAIKKPRFPTLKEFGKSILIGIGFAIGMKMFEFIGALIVVLGIIF